MKIHLQIPFVLLLVLTGQLGKAQNYREADKIDLSKAPPQLVESHTLLQFSLVGGKEYLTFEWIVQGERSYGDFFVEQSFDSLNYEIIARKRAIGTGLSIPVSYTVYTEIPIYDTVYFKLIRAFPNRTYYESIPIMYAHDPELFAEQKGFLSGLIRRKKDD